MLVMSAYQFANILLAGKCNLHCPHCIGRRAPRAFPSNLSRFPLDGLDRFIAALNRHRMVQVSVTGLNTDPQLYQHEPALLARLRERVSGVQISLHTNGLLILRKIDVFNAYDRATISLPSFRPETCRIMTGSTRVLDLAEIAKQATIPLKISILVTEHNVSELPAIVDRCQELGIHRMVLRKPFGDPRPFRSSHVSARRAAQQGQGA